MINFKEFKNKTVLVTGSTKGIGLDIAKNFIYNGAKVAINSRNKIDIKNTIKKLGANNIYSACGDVSNSKDSKKVFKSVMKSMGKLEILVCNVGSGESVKPGEENHLEWKKAFDKNFWSAINIIESCKNELIRNKGVIICISSICGSELIPNAPTTYSVAKSALNTYVKSISRPFGNLGLRINAVSPGNILFKGSVWEKKIKKNKKEVIKLIDQNVSLKKIGIPQDISNLVLWLSSDKANFITGTIITADGGQTRSF